MDRIDHTVDKAAEGIFDMLTDDLDLVEGTEQDEAPAGEEQNQDAASGDDDASSSDDDEADEEETEDDEESDEDSDGGDDDEEDEEDEESEDAEYEEDEEDELDEDDDPMVSVKVDGKTIRMPQSEALAGYSRTASWTKKSQALATERREFEAERVSVRQDREEYGRKLQILEEQLGANLTLEEPSSDDPNFERKWIQFQQANQQVQRVQQERFALQQKINTDMEADRQVRITDNNALLVEAIPEWSDTKIAKAEKKALATYAVEVMGFDPEDVDKLIDHRLVLLLRKASGYDDLQKAEKGLKKKKRKARVLRPGQSNRKSSSKGRKTRRSAKAKRDTLRQEGTVQAAADFIFDTLDDDE